MSKLINEPIRVHRKEGSAITAFIWRRRLYRVESVVAWWREAPEWWNGEPVRCFLRINARNASNCVYELCKIGNDWLLHRLLD